MFANNLQIMFFNGLVFNLKSGGNIGVGIKGYLNAGMARDNEIPEGDLTKLATTIAELFGLRTFAESAWLDFYDKAAEYIQWLSPENIGPKQGEAWS
jgi:hypothetical protein